MGAAPAREHSLACDASGVLVLDIDPRNGRSANLAQLKHEYGKLPYGPCSRTGGGGQHLFYRDPGLRPVGKLAGGVDVKYHGYVVLPNSVHESGVRYEWLVAPEEAALPTLPQAWCARLLKRPTLGTQTRPASDLAYRDGGPIFEGSRDDTLTRMAGAMRRASFSSEGIAAALAIANVERCRPPLSEGDVRRVASSVGRYAAAPRWMLDPVEFACDGELTHSEWAVLIVLCRGADYDGRVYGGYWIGKKVRLSYPTIYHALRGLEQKGRIARVDCGPRTDADGRWRANMYQIVDSAAPFITDTHNLPDRGMPT